MNKKCLTCLREFIITPNRATTAKYCSVVCRAKYLGQLQRKKHTKHTCKECFLVFYKNPSRKAVYCSRQCRAINVGQQNKGERNNLWRGGITPLNRAIRTSAQHKNWSKQVLQTWDFTCQICRIKGGYLHANHIKKFADYPELRFEVFNGISLCKNCHLKKVNRHEVEWEQYFRSCWENKMKGEDINANF